MDTPQVFDQLWRELDGELVGLLEMDAVGGAAEEADPLDSPIELDPLEFVAFEAGATASVASSTPSALLCEAQPVSSVTGSSSDSVGSEDGKSHGLPSPGGKLSMESHNARNSLKCKKFREKRKREAEMLRIRNGEIEKEREILLGKIAELQTDLLSLRGGGTTDLELENELLRREIRQHKIFVHNIVQATQSAPAITPEEKYRLLYSGLRAAVGQATGLAYTSAVDPSWKDGESIVVAGWTVHFKYQLMPLGCTVKEAKRINIRMEVLCIPIKATSLDEVCRKVKSDPDYMNEHYKHLNLDNTVRFAEDISQSQIGEVKLEPSQRKDMQVIRVRSFIKNENTREMICVVASEDVEIFPAAVSPRHAAGHDGVSVTAHVLVQSSSVTKVLPAFADDDKDSASSNKTVRVASPLLQSQVCWPDVNQPDSHSHVLFVHSYPLNDDAYCKIWGRRFPKVNKQGQMDPDYIQDMHEHFQALIAPLLSSSAPRPSGSAES